MRPRLRCGTLHIVYTRDSDIVSSRRFIERPHGYRTVKSEFRRWLIYALLCLPGLATWAFAIEISSENEVGVVDQKNSGDGPIQIRDTKLEFYVRSVTGRRRPAELRSIDIEGIVEIDLDGLGIKSLAGLEQLRALKSLSLVSNMVSSITELKTLRQLEQLDLRHNRIQSIDSLRRLDRVKTLRLDHNLIQDASPLLENKGLGSGDRVSLTDNDLDCEDMQQSLKALRRRGVNVSSDCE